MACQIKYNPLGQISEVKDSTGKISEAYKSIVKHPLVKTKGDALSIFKNVYGEKINNENAEFLHKTEQGFTTSYKEALEQSKDGDIIEIGFYGEKFVPVVRVEVTTNPNTVEGFINQQIKNNILSEERVVDPEGTYLKAKGASGSVRAINTALLEEELKFHVGIGGYKRHAGNKYSIEAIKPKEKFDSKVDQNISEELAKSSMMRTFGSDKIKESTRLTENELKLKLMNVLNALGVKVTSITDYIDNYNTKNGVDPSANALADIANKVVAFRDGVIDVTTLGEEVAHFIVEGLPQDQVENVLRNIHKTAEWAEHAHEYRTIYSKDHSGEELEQAVRREVLGKVLANSFTSNFNTEGREGIVSSIIGKIKELFESFINAITNNRNSQVNTELQDLTDQVNEMLNKDELGAYLSQENFRSNKFRFYSTANGTQGDNNPVNLIKSRSLAAIEILKRQIADLSKTNKSSGVSKEQLKQASVALKEKLGNVEEEEIVQSITTFLEVTRKQISYIETALKNNLKGEYNLSQEEVAVYQSLNNDLQPILSELRERVSKRTEPNWKTISANITSALDSISRIEGQKEVQESEVIDKLVDKVVERHNLDKEKYGDYIKTWYETAQKDTSYFHATFGQLIHAHDPLLSLAGVVIQDTMNESRIKYLKATKEFQQKLKGLGLKERDLDQFFDNGYLVDAVNHKEFEDALLDMRLKTLQKFSPEAKAMELEELRRRYKSKSRETKDTLPKPDPSVELEMNAEIRDNQNRMVERVMKAEYYKEQQDRYDKAGTRLETINILRAISQTRGSIIAGARKKDGTVDRTLLSESDNNRLDELVRDRKSAKNPHNTSGVLKRGLMLNTKEGEFEPRYVLDPNQTSSTEAIISADLHKIDALYREEASQKGEDKPGVTKKFKAALEEAQAKGNDEALNFLKLNSSLTFTNEFWESFGTNKSVVDRLKDSIENAEDLDHKRDLEVLLASIENYSERRKNILKVFQNPNNPSEMDVDQMTKETRQEIATLTENLNDAYSRAFQVIEGVDSSGVEPIHEQTTNQAYQDALEDRNIKTVGEELDFIKDHVTKSDLLKIAQLEGFLTDYQRGLGGRPPASLRNFIEENIDLEAGFDIHSEVKHYAKKKLLPYYKRLAPEGYSATMNELNTGQKSVMDFIGEIERGQHFMEVIPNYSYVQEESEMINPNYRSEYEGGFLQPKFGEYKNAKFEEMFAPEKDASGAYKREKNAEGNFVYFPTKNVKLYEGYEALKSYQRQNLEQIGETGSHSLFKLPQISKSRLEKITAFAGNASRDKVSEAWKDFSMYRVDELERGAEFDGQTLSNSKVIPKYYTRDLENEKDISTQLFTSYAAFAQQAYLHRARRNNIGDMFALREKILSRGSGHLNKTTSATNTYKMFESYIDANFFGVTEQSKLEINVLGRQIDLTKIARKFLKFIKFKNLGLSAIVPATSWLTAEVNTKIEAWVQEHTNIRSGQMALKEFKKLAPEASKEFMELNSEAPLSVLGEFMGIFDANNRFEDSSYNKKVRFGWKMGMALHQAANFPIIPRIMLSVLYDNRVVDGNIVNYNTFARQERAGDPKISDKAIETKWAAYESDTVYDFLDISKTGVEWNKKAIGEKLGKTGEELDAFLENKLNGIQSRVEEATSNIDGSISQHRQIAASRHYLMNYFMTHRNWLSIATSRRFKLEQYNLQTGEFEEGHWVSLYRFLGDYIKGVTGTNKKAFREQLKDQWADTFAEEDTQKGEMQRKNIKRAGIDLAVLNALALVGFLLANYADDDENEDLWALQMANYLYFRTMNETASSSIALPNQYMETLESPFVGLNTVQEMGKISSFFDTDEIKSGKYGGMQKWERQLIKTVPGIKQYREVENPKESSDTYRFYNSSNFDAIPMYWFLKDE